MGGQGVGGRHNTPGRDDDAQVYDTRSEMGDLRDVWEVDLGVGEGPGEGQVAAHVSGWGA